jgi:hypothetical protein
MSCDASPPYIFSAVGQVALFNLTLWLMVATILNSQQPTIFSQGRQPSPGSEADRVSRSSSNPKRREAVPSDPEFTEQVIVVE